MSMDVLFILPKEKMLEEGQEPGEGKVVVSCKTCGQKFAIEEEEIANATTCECEECFATSVNESFNDDTNTEAEDTISAALGI